MPEPVEVCVANLMEDPNFKPKEGQTKEESAWALCNWLDQQGKLEETSDGVKITMDKAKTLLTGPFKVVLPITGARRQIVEKAESGEEVQLWLHIQASGPERDSDGDRFSETGLEKMVEYAQAKKVPFLDGHHKDLLAAVFSDAIQNPYLTEEKHFAFDILLNSEANPFAIQLFNDVLSGKKHGASIAGVVHDAEIEEYGEGEFGQIFNDVELLEVSRTTWPSYRDSFITLLANKVGKLPQEEFEAVMKRRGELERIKTGGGNEMLVRTADGGTERWEENKDGDLVVKIISPHGWDKKFSVSGTPWSNVENRTKPCQYAIIKENEDGTFSTSKSGYPHHMPGCDTINRGGVIASAGRLVQALKSHVPAIETPPIVSLVTEKIGADEFNVCKQESKFAADELKYAANHIIRHYRQDLDEEPPENLVAAAKTYENEHTEIVELIKGLIRVIEGFTPNMEVKEMNDKKDVVETPVEQESTDTVPVETPTEPEIEAAPAEKQDADTPEIVSEPAGKATELGTTVDGRLQAAKFGELIYAMQEMVGNAIAEQNLEQAVSVLDDFVVLSKDVLGRLIAATSPGVSLSFLEPFEKRVELATGSLSKSRVLLIEQRIEELVKALVATRDLLKNADTVEDPIVTPAVEETAETKSRSMTEMEARLDKIEQEHKAEITDLATTLVAAPQTRERPAAEPEVVVELSGEERLAATKRMFEKSMERR